MLFEAVAPEPSDGGLHKGAVLQPSGPGRVFKDLGVAKRYCRINVISDSFLQRRPGPFRFRPHPGNFTAKRGF